MTYKDLRYGNLVKGHLTSRYLEVDWLVMKHMEDGNIQSVYTPDIPVYEPIPLTPEILVKVGFYEWSEGNWKTRNSLNKQGWSKEFNYYQPYYNLSTYCGNVTIKYLHQLQNIYFSLTDEELDIKQLITPQSAP